ncbi:MAG: thioesterase family protein [Pseudomonadales bacterium]|jgi:acyl-CoA thioesterase FadM|nr:thioesterase family protein [Pseudomonadales bacterium]
MNLYLRLLLALGHGLTGERIDHRAALYRSFRVWPHDLDVFGHMNNGRYLQIMDVARAEWMARVGVVTSMWRHRWSAVLGGGVVRFRHSLGPFQRYHVRTRLLGWDERWWFLEHSFLDAVERRVATGVSRAALRAEHGWVDSATVIAAVDPEAAPLAAPEWVVDWLDVEQAMWAHGERAFPATRRPPLALGATGD